MGMEHSSAMRETTAHWMQHTSCVMYMYQGLDLPCCLPERACAALRQRTIVQGHMWGRLMM